MIETNEPRLRFKGFNEEWNYGHISDIGVVKMNKRIHKNETSNDGEVPFFKIGTFGKKPDAFITRRRFLELKDKYPYPETGDILISASGTLGRTVVYKGKDEYFQDSNIIWLDLNDKKMVNPFLLQFYNQHRWQSEGTTIKRLYNKDIYRTSICYPGLAEQQKIGLFFSKIDKIVNLQTKKLEQLKKLKHGYLQKMFPQDGEMVPKLRFNDFSEEWKEEKLLNLVKIRTGSRNAKEALEKGKYVFFDRSSEIKYLNDYDFDDKVIVYAGEGAKFLPRKFNGKYSLHQRAYGIYGFNKINFEFLYQELFNKNNHFLKYAVGTTAKSLRKDCFERLVIKYPSFDEQQKIGLFLSKLDQIIEDQSKKIDSLKQQKKAYLQKMFI